MSRKDNHSVLEHKFKTETSKLVWDTVFKKQIMALCGIIVDVNTKLKADVSLEQECYCGFYDANLYVCGDRNVVNLIIIKMVNWQLKHCDNVLDPKVRVYPSDEMRKHEENERKTYYNK